MAIVTKLLAPSIAGPITIKENIISIKPRIPIEKLFTIISKPLGILPSIALSNFLIIHPPRGPTIIAPRNIGISAPIISPTAPRVPITAPLCPATIFPPV